MHTNSCCHLFLERAHFSRTGEIVYFNPRLGTRFINWLENYVQGLLETVDREFQVLCNLQVPFHLLF